MQVSHKEEIYNQLKEVLEDLGLPDTEITLDSNLIKDLGLDSLDIADLGFRLELKFDVHIDEMVFEKMHTVADVLALLEQLVGK